MRLAFCPNCGKVLPNHFPPELWDIIDVCRCREGDEYDQSGL